VYPVFDSVYPGGGFAGGLGARKPVGDDGAISVMGAYSINSFWRAQTDVSLPTFASNRGRVSLTARYLDAPDVKYYGIGMDTDKDAKTFFSYTPWGGGARLDFDLSPHLTVGGGVNYIDIDTGSGATGPSIDERFSPADTPGLELNQFKYVNSTARAAFDWRSRLGYAGSGGLYRVQFDDFRENDNDQYSYRSLEAEAIQLIPLLRANWVIALRGLTTMTDVENTDAVPYFMLPALGGGKTLRGYPDFRFRDRNRLLMNAELRWTPARFLDMAVFYDTGKVTARKGDINFKDLEDSYGIGMRFIGLKGYAFRVEVAHSREHQARLLVSAGGAF
jgi:outer membrane protein assembly factor BamA